MADKTLQLDIVTPNRMVFSGNVEAVTAPGTEGYFQILPGHTLYLATLQIGEMKVKRSGKDEYYSISGGFAEIHDNRVSVLAETAERASEIDAERAQASKDRAEKRLQTKNRDIDVERAQLALYRALNRLRVRERIG